MHHLGATQLEDQLLIIALKPVGDALHLIGHRPGTDRKVGQVQKDLLDLPERQSMGDPQHHRGGQAIEADLPVGNVGGGRLLAGPRLHLLAAAGTPAAARVVAGHHHPGRNDVLHQPLMIFKLHQTTLAAWTRLAALLILGKRHVLMNINVIGHWPQRRRMSWLAARLPGPAPHRGFKLWRSGCRTILRAFPRGGSQLLILLLEALVLLPQFLVALL
jgi:hypothetical protein